MRKPYFIYSYELPELKAIKVGYGENPYQRMISYTQKYNISANKNSLKKWEMPSSGIASNIEKSCHEILIKSDFKRVSLFSDDTEANEVFDLDNFSYDDAVSLIVEEIDENINFLRKSLEGKNFGEEHRKIKKSDEIIKRKKENKEVIIKQIMKEISEGYDKHYSKFIVVIQSFDKHYNSFKKEISEREGFFKNIFKKQKTYYEDLREWEGFEKIIDFVELRLKSSRPARKFFHYIHNKYEYKLIEIAQEKLQIDLYNVSFITDEHLGKSNDETIPTYFKGTLKNYNPPKNEEYREDIRQYGGEIDIAVIEVYCCLYVWEGNGFKWIRENEKLQSLVKWAKENPCPEIELEEY